MAGELYVVATPIGNLGDMVPRAIEVLQTADIIAAEDTRHSSRLLNHFSINTSMMAYHDYSDSRQSARVLNYLQEGKKVALISDAGTPLISDPGYKLVREVRQAGFNVIPIPGACAVTTALCAAGLPTDRFIFEGFLPHKSSGRKKRLEPLVTETATLVFYETPHRIIDSLADMSAVFGGERPVVVARELTKTFETFLTGSLDHVLAQVNADTNQRKGEMVILIQGAKDVVKTDEAEQKRVLTLLMEDLPLKQAAALAAKITGGQKNSLYQQALALREQ